MGIQGCSNFCQECGACGVRSAPSTSPQEDLVGTIVDAVLSDLRGNGATAAGERELTIPLGVSNRHIHLREESFKTLFGAEAVPAVYRNLYQPGEFALTQTSIIVGPKMRPIHDVRILGPFRGYDQVEVSFTDAMRLGIDPPIKDSGDLRGAAPITIVGPAGSLVLREGAIIANRHLHMAPTDAARFGVRQGDFIKVRFPGAKGSTFERVLVRTNESWKLQLHLDTDDATAAHVVCNQKAVFVGKE
jgi:putative phosphotransacetylase